MGYTIKEVLIAEAKVLQRLTEDGLTIDDFTPDEYIILIGNVLNERRNIYANT